MNNDRRKDLKAVEAGIDGVKSEIDELASREETGEAGNKDALASNEETWTETLSDLHTDLGLIRDDEQEYYDNMTEGAQSGERGETASNAIESMERAMDDLEELTSCDEVGQLTKMFHEKYDTIISELQSAQA